MEPKRPTARRTGQGLALIGPRGTGKSTVGRIVARRLGRPFLDTDELVERTSGRAIPAIFADWGEPHFRELEEQAVMTLTRSGQGVLATGGGVVLRESNRNALRGFGFVVWLTGAPRALADRLLADPAALANRPALTSAGTVEEIAVIMAAREALYRETAHAAIDTTSRSADEVAEAVLTLWSEAEALAGEAAP